MNMGKLKLANMRFIDENENHIILRGINLVCKKPETGFVYPCDESLFAKFKQYGFNIIRLGLQWNAIEPQPGVYNDIYLEKIKQQIIWAEKYGIYVFLDMHQDLFGIAYDNGAPPWATLDGGQTHTTGDMWADAYLKSDALCHAFDAFWNNEKEPGGIGLQDRFADMWVHTANFFSNCKNIAGFDILNEPYPGSYGREIFSKIAEELAGCANTGLHSSTDISQVLNDKRKLLPLLNNMQLYQRITNAAEETSQCFEKEALSKFYKKISTAILNVCPNWFMFKEANYFTNMGIGAYIDTNPKNNCVFAPHGYELVVDSDMHDLYNENRVEYIFNKHRSAQQKTSLPVLIGEWGAFGNYPDTQKHITHLLNMFDSNLWGYTYWCWYEGIDTDGYWKTLCRPYAKVVSGEIKKMECNNNNFTLTFKAKKGLSVIHHPQAILLKKNMINTSGIECDITIVPYSPDKNSGEIHILQKNGGDAADAAINISITE